MINKLKTHQNMTLKELESVSGGAVPWAAISVLICIISTLLLILLINLIFYVRLGTPIIDTNLKSACSTLIFFLPIFLLTREKEKPKAKTE